MILVVGELFREAKIQARNEGVTPDVVDADIVLAWGGQAMRTAAWLAHAGSRVRICAAAGENDRTLLESELATRGIESAASYSKERASGVFARLSGEGESPRAYVDYGAQLPGAIKELGPGVLDGISWIHISGFVLRTEHGRSLVRELIEHAKESGLGVSLDPGSAAIVRQATAQLFTEWVSGIDLIFPNLDETRVLVGATGPFIDFESLGTNFPHATVSLGAMGAAYLGNGVREQAAAARVEHIDRAGVGDAFAAGFLNKWAVGADPKTSLAHANALAQQCLQIRGALP